MATRFVATAKNMDPPASNAPGILRMEVSGVPRLLAAFDATTDETGYWQFSAPQGLSGTLTLLLRYAMASAASGAVRFGAQVEAITPGDSIDIDTTNSFDTANTNGQTVPGTAGYIAEISITLTNADSIQPGDECRLAIYRDADQTSGTDDAAGDAYLISAELRDAA